jgi:hypothetical protein
VIEFDSIDKRLDIVALDVRFDKTGLVYVNLISEDFWWENYRVSVMLRDEILKVN